VKVWLSWAVRQFNLTGIKQSEWAITGEHLVDMTHEEFQEKYKRDKNGIFWTHLELLRRCDVFGESSLPEPATNLIYGRMCRVRMHKREKN